MPPPCADDCSGIIMQIAAGQLITVAEAEPTAGSKHWLQAVQEIWSGTSYLKAYGWLVPDCRYCLLLTLFSEQDLCHIAAQRMQARHLCICRIIALCVLSNSSNRKT